MEKLQSDDCSNSRKRPILTTVDQGGTASSDDSFDEPIVRSALKKSKDGSPIADLSSSTNLVKRSPRIKLSIESPSVSDWDESPIKPVANQPTPFAGRKSSTPQKDPIQANKENVHDSFDDSFDASFSGRKSVTPNKGPLCPNNQRIHDSFDSVTDDSFDASSPHKLTQTVAKESGVGGFPSLTDAKNTVLLTIKKVVREEFGVDLICTTAKGEETIVYVQGEWIASTENVDEGMRIRLIGSKKWGVKDWLVDDESGVLVVDPNTLVPCTAVASASWCPRKVVLNDRFKGGGEANKAMLIGCIMHELFQVAVECPDPAQVSHEWLLNHWRSNISTSVMESLAALNFTPRGFETELQPYADVIVSWVRSHISGRGKIFSNKAPLPTGSSVVEIHDIEENIWEPLLGVKGKIDASIKTRKKDGTVLIEPLELKTGKSGQSFEHAGQVLLYCMMLSARYDDSIGPGSLLYLKDGVNRPVIGRELELKGLIRTRNRLAAHLGKIGANRLPEPRADPHFCGKCEQALTCSLYQHISPDQNASEKFREFAQQQVAHLNGSEIDYFIKWVNWIYAEWNAERKQNKRSTADLWNIDADTRESFGNCAANLKLASSIAMENGPGVMLRFERDGYIREGMLTAGSMCTVSTDSKYGIVLAFIAASDEHSVTVRAERQFRLLRVGESYHLDPYDSYSTYATTLGNVLLLMMPDEMSTRHRSLIVDLRPPVVLEPDHTLLPQTVSRILAENALNEGQSTAVMKSLFSSDYSLIEGFPGTGKTTTIAVLVRCLVAQGKSVLICSNTHSAVDTILIKLDKSMGSSNLLRLGRPSRSDVSHLVMSSKLSAMEGEIDEYKETRNILKNTPVVACTCHHTSREVLFSWRKFDVCIVDEASMVLEPVVLSALSTSTRFVMVGDTKQLAPLVKDKAAGEAGMAISLFERLHVHREAVTSLVQQYRMNRVIAQLSSDLFYDGRLVCADEQIASACLSSIHSEYTTPSTEDGFLSSCLSGSLDDSCVFVDTLSEERLDSRMTQRVGGMVYNDEEARLAVLLVNQLLQNGLSADDIGVMCLYRKQVDIIKNLLNNLDVEVNTVDQYQGRDKSVIIWSLVWTADSGKRSDLLANERRINVGLSRAKHKLVLLGCQKSLRQIPIMEKVLHRISRIIPMP